METRVSRPASSAERKGGRSFVVFFGALIALTASLAAMLLVRLQDGGVSRPLRSPRNPGRAPEDAGLIDRLLEQDSLILVVLGLASVVSLVLVAVAVGMLLDETRARGRSMAGTAITPEVREWQPDSETGGREDDRPLENKPWIRLVEECAELVDELDEHKGGLDPARRQLAEHVISRLEEGLERSGVEVISEDTTFDRNRHKPAAGSAAIHGAAISETLSPGFAVGRRVVRRARVRVG